MRASGGEPAAPLASGSNHHSPYIAIASCDTSAQLSGRLRLGCLGSTNSTNNSVSRPCWLISRNWTTWDRLRFPERSPGPDDTSRANHGRVTGRFRCVRTGDSAGTCARRLGPRPAERQEAGSAHHSGDQSPRRAGTALCREFSAIMQSGPALGFWRLSALTARSSPSWHER